MLLACEVGSRAWGLDAPSSDYDVKFIYVRRLEWYISIEDNKRDLIDDNSDFDMNGWDLRKALQLLRETNCGVLEWLHSQLIYKADPLFLAKAKALAASAHCRRSLLLAYWGKAGKHYREYIDVPSNNGTVILKKYLFVIQALLSALWINSFSLDSQDLPPADFSTLLHSFQGTVYALPTNIHDIAFKFMTEKRAGTLKTGPRLGFLGSFDSFLPFSHRRSFLTMPLIRLQL